MCATCQRGREKRGAAQEMKMLIVRRSVRDRCCDPTRSLLASSHEQSARARCFEQRCAPASSKVQRYRTSQSPAVCRTRAGDSRSSQMQTLAMRIGGQAPGHYFALHRPAQPWIWRQDLADYLAVSCTYHRWRSSLQTHGIECKSSIWGRSIRHHQEVHLLSANSDRHYRGAYPQYLARPAT